MIRVPLSFPLWQIGDQGFGVKLWAGWQCPDWVLHYRLPVLSPKLNIPRGRACFRTSRTLEGEGKTSSSLPCWANIHAPSSLTPTSQNGRWELRLFLINKVPTRLFGWEEVPQMGGCWALIGWLPEPNHVLRQMTMGGSPFPPTPTWPDRTSFRPICPLTGRGRAATLSPLLPLLCNLNFGKWPFG